MEWPQQKDRGCDTPRAKNRRGPLAVHRNRTQAPAVLRARARGRMSARAGLQAARKAPQDLPSKNTSSKEPHGMASAKRSRLRHSPCQEPARTSRRTPKPHPNPSSAAGKGTWEDECKGRSAGSSKGPTGPAVEKHIVKGAAWNGPSKKIEAATLPVPGTGEDLSPYTETAPKPQQCCGQ